MPATGRIIHLDRIVQTIALDDPTVRCLPAAPPTAAGTRRFRPGLSGVGKSGKLVTLGETAA